MLEPPPAAPPAPAAEASPVPHAPEEVPPAVEAQAAPPPAVPGVAEPVPIAAPQESAPASAEEPSREGMARMSSARRVAQWAGMILVALLLGEFRHTKPPPPLPPGASMRIPEWGASLPPRLGPWLPTWEGGSGSGKVAPPLDPPEAERAAPLVPEVSPAAQQREASVNTKQNKQQPVRLGSLKKKAALAATCTTLACSSGPTTEVRPPEARPTPITAAPCPPGALKAMEQLGIRIGQEADGELPHKRLGAEWITVKEGGTTVKTGDNLGKLDAGTVFSGRLIVGQRGVRGQMVQATTEDGQTFPVCLEFTNEKTKEGKVDSTVTLEAVDKFQ
jgi:eukaryotic-like serine/threonine-protein kinase